MVINVSNSFSEQADIFIGFDDGSLGIGFSADDLGNTVFAGVGGAVSQELKSITGSNLLSAGEIVSVFEKLLTSEGKRGGPEGVDGVGLVSVTEDVVVLSFDGINGAVDTITFRFEDGLLDSLLGGGQNAGDQKSTYAVIEDGETIIGTSFIGKANSEHSVGGTIKGAKDTATVLEAALDDDFGVVELAGLSDDSFSVTINKGAASDTYTFVGDNAASAIAKNFDPFINPGDRFDQFVFVDGAASENQLIGIGMSSSGGGVFGGQLRVGEVVDFVEAGDTAPGIDVTDLGTTVKVEFAGGSGSTDTIFFADELFA